jgi:hypothetical protein
MSKNCCQSLAAADHRPGAFRPINHRFYTINYGGLIAPRNKNDSKSDANFIFATDYQSLTNNYNPLKNAQISKKTLKILHFETWSPAFVLVLVLEASSRQIRTPNDPNKTM